MAEATLDTDTEPLPPRPTPRDETSIESKKPLDVPLVPNDLPFRRLLLDIGEYITDEVLGKIKFLYGDELKAGTCKKISIPRDLFEILMQRRYITPENVFHLQTIVRTIGDNGIKVDLMERIYEYSRKHKAVFYREITDDPPNGYRRLRFHVEGLKHYEFDTEAANKLRIAVASLTGANIGEVLVDGMQLTNSIYVTLLIPDCHYILFSSLIKNGIPLLTELKINMVTLEDGTTMKASNGSQIVEELPPIRESPDETIQRLKEGLDELQIENIAYRQLIEDLSLPDGFEEVSGDLKAISRQFEESKNEATEKHANRQLLQRIVSLNTRPVKGIESEKMRTKQKQLKLELLEHKHAGILETRKREDDIVTIKLNDLLQKFNARINQTEKIALRTKFPSTNGCTDDELLYKIVCDNFQKFTGQSENFIKFMTELFTSIQRDAFLAEFRREYYQLRDGLLPEMQDILYVR